jgi:ketosteroid isomerase-like protein
MNLMKIMLAMLFAVPLAMPEAAGLQVPPDADIKAQVRAWDQAYQARNVQALSRILADDFTITDAAGAVLTKSAYLMSVVKRPEFDQSAASVESYDVTVKVDGDKAVVTGRSPVKGRPRGKASTVAGNYRFTDEWVRLQGVWKARQSRVEAAR